MTTVEMSAKFFQFQIVNRELSALDHLATAWSKDMLYVMLWGEQENSTVSPLTYRRQWHNLRAQSGLHYSEGYLQVRMQMAWFSQARPQ